jgi:dTDP-4-dehydrorhamnose reductase
MKSLEVFDGDNAPYSPTSVPNPLTIYGETKRDAELALLGKAVVIRFSVMYGLGGSFFQLIYDKLSSNTRVELFEDEFRSFMMATEGMEMLLTLLEKNVDKGRVTRRIHTFICIIVEI